MMSTQPTTLADLARDRARCDAWSTTALAGLLLVTAIPAITPATFPPLLRIFLIALTTFTIVLFTTRAGVEAVAAVRTREPLGRTFAVSTLRSCMIFALLTIAILTYHLNPTPRGWLFVGGAGLLAGLLLLMDVIPSLHQQQAVREP